MGQIKVLIYININCTHSCNDLKLGTQIVLLNGKKNVYKYFVYTIICSYIGNSIQEIFIFHFYISLSDHRHY